MKRARRLVLVGAIGVLVLGGWIASPLFEPRKWKTRPIGRRLESMVLPAAAADHIAWATLVDSGGRIFAFGVARSTGPSLAIVEVDRIGKRITPVLADVKCEAIAGVQSVSKSHVVLACDLTDGLEWWAIELAGETKAMRLGQTRRRDQQRNFWTARSTRNHMWMVPTGTDVYELGFAEGRSLPAFKTVRIAEVSGFAALSDNEVLVVRVKGRTSVELSVVDSAGTILRSLSLAQNEHEKRFPSVINDGRQVVVGWVEWLSRWLGSPLAAPRSALMFQRLSPRLDLVGGAVRISDDNHVVPFGIASVDGGSVIYWNQGIRASWSAASFVWFSSGGDPAREPVFRIPTKQLPQTVVGSEDALAGLMDPWAGVHEGKKAEAYVEFFTAKGAPLTP